MLTNNNNFVAGTQNRKPLLIALVTNCPLAGRSHTTKLLGDITSTILFVSIYTYTKLINCPNFFFQTCFVFAESTQLEDPRQEWKSIQEHMLREYLTSAQEVLVAKKEIFDVKHQRLLLAQDEYNLLNALAASRSSRECFFFSRLNKLRM